MANQYNNAQVVSKTFALICSYRVPSTEVNPDFVPSVSVVVGEYDSQEQAKQANQSQQRIKARHSAAQSADNTIAATATLNADTSEIKGANHV